MEIREAVESDIPKIVNLLKLSLGETLMPKSERFWRWKHLENPFGPSSVLLCWEGSELIGVRAFMRWEWTHYSRVYKALRAVDTATHPNHQGKGIFRKLTMSLVDRCIKAGDDFVFNTPNQQSKPGYLKMGWEAVGRLPVKISIHRPFNIAKSIILQSSVSKNENRNSELESYLSNANLEELVAEYRKHTSRLITNISVPYLLWRYKNVPVANYVALGDEKDGKLRGLVIGRIKETRFGTQFRITDHLLMEQSGKHIISKIKESIREWNIDYSTLTGTGSSNSSRSVLPSINIVAQAGPIVTARSLNMTDLHMLKNFNQWSPSLGDLELF